MKMIHRTFVLTYILSWSCIVIGITIKSETSEVVGIVGKDLTLRWNITKQTNEKFELQYLYLNNSSEEVLIGDIITSDGKRLFKDRISRVWTENINEAFYEFTLKSISYNDSYTYQLGLLMNIGDNYWKSNRSSVTVQVKGGVELCKKQLQLSNNITFNEHSIIKNTIHLCGEPKPKVVYSINDDEDDIEGSLVNYATRKYKYDLNIKSKLSYCGSTLKYKFVGIKNMTYNITFLPGKVEDIKYTFNKTNCTVVEWKRLSYGTCFKGLKYILIFKTKKNGVNIERLTTTINQTRFVECGNDLFDAIKVNVTAVYGELQGTSSDDTERVNIIVPTKITTTTSRDNISRSNLLLIVLCICGFMVLFLCCCLYWVFKKNARGQNLLLRLSRPNKSKVEHDSLKKEKNKTDSMGSPGAQSENPTYPSDSPFSERELSVASPKIKDKEQPSEDIPLIKQVTQDPVYAPISDVETNEESIPMYSAQRNQTNPYVNVTDECSEYDTVADLAPKTDIPTYAVVDKSKKTNKKEPEIYETFNGKQSHYDDATDGMTKPLLVNTVEQKHADTDSDYALVSDLSPPPTTTYKPFGKSSPSDYEEIDNL